MALKVLMLRKKLDEAKKQMAALRETEKSFEKREEELATAIEEASTEEEQKTVEDAVAEFEADKERNSDEIGKLADTIAQIEADIATEEARQDTTPTEEKREEVKPMSTRSKIFAKLNMEQRAAMFEQQDVKDFLARAREAITNKRAITNAGLLIPKVFLGLLRENIEEYSKLYKHVFVRPVNGTARETVMGTIPEGVWTEMCANLNELDLGFNDVEVDGYKVGGFFAICNATLEDSDIDLAGEILTALAQAIGLALDKAILYGTGTKMPLGVVTRLAQTEEPASYSETERAWVDLHTTNIISISAANTDGIKLFKNIILASGAAKGKYARGEKVWCMNETTRTRLLAEGLSINAAGVIVSGMNGTMPVVGGVAEVLSFIPDNVIIGGYFELYLLAERAGTRLAQSEHVRFIQDQTVFKGTARYDGKPVIAEGFVAIGINGVTPNATMSFASDTANA